MTRIQGKQRRDDQARWFQHYKWLHFNQDDNSVLCYICMKQYHHGNLTTRNKDMAFIFHNWKDALGLFMKHEKSVCRSTACTYENVVPKCVNIRESNDVPLKEEMRQNKNVSL